MNNPAPNLHISAPLLEMVGVPENIKLLLSMKTWQSQMRANYELIGEVAIRRGTLQDDSLSPELFVNATFRLTHIHVIAGYFSKRERECIHLLFRDDVKLHGRDEIAVASTQKLSK